MNCRTCGCPEFCGQPHFRSQGFQAETDDPVRMFSQVCSFCEEDRRTANVIPACRIPATHVVADRKWGLLFFCEKHAKPKAAR